MNICEFQFTAIPKGAPLAAGPEIPANALELPVLREKYEVELSVVPPGQLQPAEKATGEVYGWNFAEDCGECLMLRESLFRILTGQCGEDDLELTGGTLWDAIVPPGSPIEALYDKWRMSMGDTSLFHIRLIFPPELSILPWETAYLRQEEQFLAKHKRYVVVRDTNPCPAPVRPPRNGELRVLLVMPGGAKLDVVEEEKRLRDALHQSGIGAQAVLKSVGNSVHPENLRDILRSQDWEIVHFSGHGGDGTIRLNRAGTVEENLISHDLFAQLFRDSHVGLVVLNCCRGASATRGRKFGGLGHKLRRQGVGAVVAMRYDVQEESALTFTSSFYGALFGKQYPGRIDLAANGACDGLIVRELRDPFTPALFLGRDCQQLFTLRVEATPVAQPAPPPPPPPPRTARSSELEAALTAVEAGRCIFVVGPGILQVGAQRDQAAGWPPTVLDLAQQLAHCPECPYPRFDPDSAWCRAGGEALAGQLLQWVSQHLHSNDKDDVLTRELQRAYAGCSCPDAVRLIARWRVPAVFYTFFDGMLERQVDTPESFRTHKIVGVPLRNDAEREGTVNAWLRENEDRYSAAQQPPNSPGCRLLVLLRGSLRKLESLRVNEEHHEELWDEIGGMSDLLSAVIRNSPTRSLFILGADPADPLVRRVAKKLLPISGSMRPFGPTFVVCSGPNERDRSYWQRFKAQWIQEPLGDVIRAVSDVWK